MIKRILKFCLGVISLLLLSALLFAYWPTHPSTTPQVHFAYSAAIDQYVCAADARKQIKPAWYQELYQRKPLLEKQWQQVGPKLLAMTSLVVGKPFDYANVDARLVLCPNIPGFSLPIIIPVRMYLKTATQHTWHESEFVDMVFHEMLHLYVVKALHWNYWTPLLRKYGDEDFNTKIHLHLYALQKTVYDRLGMQKQWRLVISRAQEFPPQYRRALAIIDKEGPQAFINELKLN